MARGDEEKIKVLEASIKMLEERYQLFNKLYEGAKSKTLTFLGAGFALLVYLYSNPSRDAKKLLGLPFVPDETYGKLFYFLSLYLIITSMYSLFKCVQGVQWIYPGDDVILKKIEKKETQLSTLQYIRDEYMEACTANNGTYVKRLKVLNESLLKLTLGGIMIVLIKFFGSP